MLPTTSPRGLSARAARLLLTASGLALLSGLPRPAPAATATFFDSIFEGRAEFDDRVARAGGTVNTELLTSLTTNANSWSRSAFTITSGDGTNRTTRTTSFANIQGPNGSFTSGNGIRMEAAASNPAGSGLVFTFASPINAFGVELEGWATCCFPSALYISFDGGTPILVGTANARSDNPGDARYGQVLTFVGAISDSATFSTIGFYGAASGDTMFGGGTIRYATVPIGGLTGGTAIDTTRAFFSEGDSAAQGATVTFRGGTFRPTGAVVMNQPIVVESTNGQIDTTQGHVVLLGAITGDGQLQLLGGGVLTLQGQGTNSGGALVQSGTLAVQGELAGPVVVQAGGTLRGGGRVGGATTIDGTLAPGASPGVMTFTAPVTLGAGATTRIEIDGPTAGTGAGFHDLVLVTGAGTTLTAGGTLQPVLRGISGGATNAFTPAIGQAFRVIVAEGGLVGSFAGLTQPMDGLPAGARFDAIYGATTLDLVATPARYADLAPLGIGQRRNQVAVGGALDAIRPAAGLRMEGDLAATFGALYGLPLQAVPAALDQISGVVHADAIAGALAHRRIFGTGVAQRMTAMRGPDPMLVAAQGALAPRIGLDAGRRAEMSVTPGGSAEDEAGGTPAGWTGWSVWGRALGSRGSTDGDGAAPGHSRESGGALVGADRRLTPALTAGIALGFLRGTIEGDGGTGDVRLDSYQLSAYALYMPPTQATTRPFLDAALGLGFSRYEGRRSIAFGTLARGARGDADGTDLSLESGVGVVTRLSGVDVEPRAYLRWDRIARDGFAETGAGSLNLAVDAKTADAVRAGLGVNAGRSFNLSDGLVLRPEARIGFAREMQDGVGSSTHRLGGAAFGVETAQPGRDMATAGLGLTAMRGANFAVVAEYDAARSDRVTDHLLTVGLRWVW